MSSGADGAAVEAEGLAREFADGVRAVDGINLSVAAGEICGFLGPNGAGKSTTIRMLTTLLAPTAGAARVAGYDVVSQPAEVRDAIGVTLQDAALDPMLTGHEHMRLQAMLQGVPRSERVSRGAELLERIGLTEAASRKVATYSGGMKRRLDLALALVHRPRVLFLDEPTAGLDVQSRLALWDEVRHLARDSGVTVFLTTQYLEEADALADRVLIIDRGQIVAQGTPAALKAENGSPAVEIVPHDGDQLGALESVLVGFGELSGGSVKGAAVRLRGGEQDLAKILIALDQAQIGVERVQLHAPSLDDVFLAHTGRWLEGARGPGTEGAAAEGQGVGG